MALQFSDFRHGMTAINSKQLLIMRSIITKPTMASAEGLHPAKI